VFLELPKTSSKLFIFPRVIASMEMRMRLLPITLIIFIIMAPSVVSDSENIVSIMAPAVTPDGFGVLTEIEIEVIPGRGRVLLNTEPFVGLQTQNSEKIAADIASKYTGIDHSDKDIIVTFRVNASSIDGPSAGAAITTAIISAMSGTEMRDDVGISGTIEPDGSVGPVGSLPSKIEASANSGHTIFLIPSEQEFIPVIVEVEEHPSPGWTIMRTETIYLNLIEYGEESFGIEVLPVRTISDVIDIMLNGKLPSTAVDFGGDLGIVLGELNISETSKPLKGLADETIREAAELINDVEGRLVSTNLSSAQSSVVISHIDSAISELSISKNAYTSNVLYGAANHAFRSVINARIALDLIKYTSLDVDSSLSYLGSRISDVGRKLDAVKIDLENLNHYASDRVSYEWAVAAEQRLTQAEMQFYSQGEDEEEIFRTLAITEGWLEIADNFYDISVDKASGERFDASTFSELAAESLINATSLASQFYDVSEYGPFWYVSLAEENLNKSWFVASYVDSMAATTKMYSQQEMNLRGLEDLILFLGDELSSLETEDSVWSELYRDYALFLLERSQKVQSINLLEDAMFYLRLSEAHATLKNTVSTFPDEPSTEPWASDTLLPLAIGALVVFFAILSYTNQKRILLPKPRRR
jgi:uncharacterized protein